MKGFTKETAKKAGQTSRRGKGVKTEQWEALGDFLTEKGARRAMEVLDALDDEAYLEQYGKLLNYFKPKRQATQVEAKVETEFKGDPFKQIRDNAGVTD